MSRFFQFVIGFIIGITIVAGSAAGAAYYLITRHNTEPPKPVFAEDSTQISQTNNQSESSEPPPDTTTTEPQTTASEPEPEPQTNLPAGAYLAAVTWPQGLSLRQEPTIDAQRIGGVSYNAELIILSESSDGEWQKVRLPASGQEGWVKAGNVKRLE